MQKGVQNLCMSEPTLGRGLTTTILALNINTHEQIVLTSLPFI